MCELEALQLDDGPDCSVVGHELTAGKGEYREVQACVCSCVCDPRLEYHSACECPSGAACRDVLVYRDRVGVGVSE